MFLIDFIFIFLFALCFWATILECVQKSIWISISAQIPLSKFWDVANDYGLRTEKGKKKNTNRGLCGLLQNYELSRGFIFSE